MLKRQSLWLAVFAVVSLLVACSGGDSVSETKAGAGAEDNAAPDACAVLTAEDVEQVLGVVASLQPSDQLKSIATTSLCSYESADGRNLASVLVRVGPLSLDAQTNLKQYVDGIKTNMGDAYQVEPVEGLSGPAVWNPDMKQLTVFKGSTLAIVTVFGEGEGDLLTPARTLAERALAKL